MAHIASSHYNAHQCPRKLGPRRPKPVILAASQDACSTTAVQRLRHPFATSCPHMLACNAGGLEVRWLPPV